LNWLTKSRFAVDVKEDNSRFPSGMTTKKHGRLYGMTTERTAGSYGVTTKEHGRLYASCSFELKVRSR
jgi:hypothetical protein